MSDQRTFVTIPSKELATNVVGQLILAKGNLNKYAACVEALIDCIRNDFIQERAALERSNKELREALALIRDCDPSHDHCKYGSDEWYAICANSMRLTANAALSAADANGENNG